MKKPIFITSGLLGASLIMSGTVFAQGMMGYRSLTPDNAAIQSQEQEEQEGKQLLDNLSSNTVACAQLNDSDFEKIGEYVMGQSIGDTTRHIAMNEMMKRMMGEQGEAQMHTVMGKRYSGCDTSVAFPSQDAGFLPMMGMMWGGSSPYGFHLNNNSMMNYGYTPFGGFGWLFMILWWALIIAIVFALIKWLIGQSRGGHHDHEKSPLDILKERYAKGEIDKKEFADKKKELS